MPGSKRRALKNLLSPHHSPSNPSKTSSPLQPVPSGASLAPVDSAQSNVSVASIASNPGNYLSDEQLSDELAIENNGGQRESGSGGVPPLGYESGGLPPASVPPPQPTEVLGRQGDMENAGSGGKKKSSKQKFEERQARKKEAMLNSAPPSDPAWDARLEKERQEEISVISDACSTLGREIYEIAPDGHCMYHAIADQLASLGEIPSDHRDNPGYTRKAAAKYMLANPDEFRFFLPSVNGEDMAGATEHEGVMTEEEYKKYCANVENTGDWGGEPEIQALSRSFNIPIHVIQRGPPTVVSHGGANDTAGGCLTPAQSVAEGDRVVRISYHRRMYGLGEHYNSLRVAAK